jgi:CoA:oxalate CoA-transferase
MVLSDITVVDLSLQLPGPYATMLLHDMGARVISVEPPGGDVARELDPPMFELLNAGKEAIELDLRSALGADVLARLARIADVFVEGFRPGVAERLGAGYDQLAAIRPDVVYCSISGYGQSGPLRDAPGHDLNYLGVAAGLPHEGAADPTPAQIGMPVVDLAAGTTAALAMVAALRERDRTGEGRYLDMAMLDAAVVWANLKRPPSDDSGGEPAYGVFAAADGRTLSVGVLEDKFWRALCDVLGWSQWAADPELADHAGRRHRAPEIAARLAAALAERPRDEWLSALAAADVPAAPVNAPAEVVLDPQVVERSLYSGEPPRLRTPLPLEIAGAGGGEPPARNGDAHRLMAELGVAGEAAP